MGNLKYESNAEKIIENFKNMTVIAQKKEYPSLTIQ